MFFIPTTMSETNAQRQILAAMIERGRTRLNNTFSLIHTHEPNDIRPITLGCYGLYRLNLVGVAIIGLEDGAEVAVKQYAEMVDTMQAQTFHHLHIEYAAAAAILGLPSQLLWETDFQAHIGLSIDSIIEKLRKPQDGCC